MEFRIAATFTSALARLETAEQKAAKTTAFDLQMDPAAPGLKFHRIERSPRPAFLVGAGQWRHPHHHPQDRGELPPGLCRPPRRCLRLGRAPPDRGAPAHRRHPNRGSAGAGRGNRRTTAHRPVPRHPAQIFRTLSAEDLSSIGVPLDWVEDIRSATEDAFLALSDHLPAEASEALLEYVTTGRLHRPAPVPAPADPFAHPDALRRFRIVENQEALALALDAPWEQWAVFLHPAQRGIVDRGYNGPARTAGSAGTGKTVVALHRAARLARTTPEAKVLLTTFSQPLANALSRKLAVLFGEDTALARRVTVAPWHTVADELHQLAFGRRAVVASDEQVEDAVAKSIDAVGVKGFTLRFLLSEWRHVVDAWQIADVAGVREGAPAWAARTHERGTAGAPLAGVRRGARVAGEARPGDMG